VVFARVIEAGSFTAAARLLGMPKTTVSRRIAALEREVGVRLLQRTTRSLNVTDAGRLYTRRAARRCGQSKMRIYGSRKREQSLRAQSGYRLQSALAVTFCPARFSIF
jgi:DNA-binding transcriptional LysR family regulator